MKWRIADRWCFWIPKKKGKRKEREKKEKEEKEEGNEKKIIVWSFLESNVHDVDDSIEWNKIDAMYEIIKVNKYQLL